MTNYTIIHRGITKSKREYQLRYFKADSSSVYSVFPNQLFEVTGGIERELQFGSNKADKDQPIPWDNFEQMVGYMERRYLVESRLPDIIPFVTKWWSRRSHGAIQGHIGLEYGEWGDHHLCRIYASPSNPGYIIHSVRTTNNFPWHSDYDEMTSEKVADLTGMTFHNGVFGTSDEDWTIALVDHKFCRHLRGVNLYEMRDLVNEINSTPIAVMAV